MNTHTAPQDTETPQAATVSIRVIVAIFTASLGVMLLIFGFASLKDLATLKTVPEAIWNFICGRPSDDGITLPLMFTLGTLALLISGGLTVWGYWRGRNQPQSDELTTGQ